MTLEHLPYLLAMLLLAIGIYAIVAKKNLIKIILGLIVVEYAVNLFLLLVGYRAGGIAPILSPGMTQESFVAHSVDPVPQALVLTSIVIGLGVLALLVALAIRLYDRFGTFDITEIRKLWG